VLLPLALDPGIALRRTTYLSRMIQRCGKLPLVFLEALDWKEKRHASSGTEDWFMHPLLNPGSFLAIDESTERSVTRVGTTSSTGLSISLNIAIAGFIVFVMLASRGSPEHGAADRLEKFRSKASRRWSGCWISAMLWSSLRISDTALKSAGV
jgi:hypothetical protein